MSRGAWTDRLRAVAPGCEWPGPNIRNCRDRVGGEGRGSIGGVMTGVRAVLLDLDGTLFDHRGAADRAAAEWASIVGVTAGDEPAGRWRVLESRFFPLFERGECSFQDQRRLRVRAFDRSLENVSDVDVDALFGEYLALYRKNWQALPGATDLMERALAAGCRIGVLTNGDEAQQREKLAAIGLMRPDLAVFASSGLGYAKPAARAFEQACMGLGAVMSETVMVGDDYDKDVLAARAAGLQAIHVRDDPAATDGEALRSLWEVADVLFGTE